MIDPIGPGRISTAALGAVSGTQPRPAELAGAAMTTLSARVATTMTRELGLADRQGGKGHAGAKAGDLYGVDELASQLNAALGGTPADAGRLSRALHEFTGELAALLAAKPHSSILGMVSGLHFNLVDGDGRPGSTDADYAFSAIQAGTFRLRADAPWGVSPDANW